MSVTSVKFLPQGWEGGWNNLRQRTYATQWKVHTNSRHDGPYTIRAATHTVTVAGVPTVVPWVPRVGDSYYVSPTELDVGSFAVEVSTKWVQLVNDTDPMTGDPVLGCEWVASVQYGPYDAGLFGADPTLWPIRLKFAGTRYERVVLIDQAGNPILNSAGCPFEDPVTIDESRSSITVTRNELVATVPAGGGHPAIPGFDPTWAEVYRDTLNDDVWNGFAARTVKCGTIETSDEQYDSNSQRYYYTVTYPFEINRDTWRKKILDQGTMAVDLAGNLADILDDDGKAVKEGVLLDGSGHVLAGGGTPVNLTFDAYPAVPFGPFNIDFTHALGR